jgi:prepilin-type N-terminal cleavage/methylation domain-containing protein
MRTINRMQLMGSITGTPRQYGFTLLEILIAMSISLVVLGAITTIMVANMNEIGSMQAKLNSLNLVTEIRNQLQRSTSCMAGITTSYYTLNSNGEFAFQFKMPSGKIIAPGSDLSATDSVIINSLNFTKTRDVGVVGNVTTVLGKLILGSTSAKGKKLQFAPSVVTTELAISYNNSSNQILNCSSGADLVATTLSASPQATGSACGSGIVVGGRCCIMTGLKISDDTTMQLLECSQVAN